MVVRFDLGEDVHLLFAVAVKTVGVGLQALHCRAFDDRRVVGIGDDRTLRMPAMRLADHSEQRLVARLAVDGPQGVEDLVPAMLGVRLREHHQFDVARIALRAAKEIDEVIDLVVGQGEPEQGVRLDQGSAASGEQIDAAQRLRREVAKQLASLCEVRQHGLQHAVMKHGGDDRPLGRRQGVPPAGQAVGDATLDARDPLQTAVVRDVGGFRRPRRDRADAWRDQEEITLRLVVGRTFLEQRRELAAIACRRRFVAGDEMPILGADDLRPGDDERKSLLQSLQAERREGGGTAKKQEFGHGGLCTAAGRLR
ncbi:MAG: hypothetical protein AW07_02950 [Candidatus Accumulibacter sp. SK-11]|nr:MAG: hypothetical protein AW07_02950 [Candidatus Accumulibacter sp. SK-11]